jgi:predicted DNA-binding transcriptional regulator AlpA
MTTTDVLLTARDLAARYKVHEITIWGWAKNGVLPPPIRLARGTTRWRLSDVERREAERTGVARHG